MKEFCQKARILYQNLKLLTLLIKAMKDSSSGKNGNYVRKTKSDQAPSLRPIGFLLVASVTSKMTAPKIYSHIHF